MQSDTTAVSIALVFFKIAAIIIATNGQKTLDWQLSKVILFGMYNCKFEAINYVLNKRMKWNRNMEYGHETEEMEYGLYGICTVIFYLILCIRFWKKLLMLSLR